MTKPIKDVGASVRQRLLNIAKLQKEDFQLVLSRYQIERFLYRLSCSAHKKRFAVKGAALFFLWVPDKVFHRSTRDLDLRGEGQFQPDQLKEIFTEICLQEVPDDGLLFEPTSVTETPIRINERDQGYRLKIQAKLSGSSSWLQIDVGLDHQVVPPVQSVNFPTLLDHPSAEVLAYRPEAVIAEKFHAMVDKDMANSRMKDFYDVRFLSRTFPFEGKVLSQAITSVFQTRGTPLTLTPAALTPEFALAKNVQWEAFLRKSRLPQEPFAPVIEEIANFLDPINRSLVNGAALSLEWKPAGPWS